MSYSILASSGYMHRSGIAGSYGGFILKKTTDFCILFFYSANLLNLFISSNSFYFKIKLLMIFHLEVYVTWD